MNKKSLYEAKGHFKIVNVSKKGKSKEISIWFPYGTVGSGSVCNLVTDKLMYQIKTVDYIGGQVWDCEIIASINNE